MGGVFGAAPTLNTNAGATYKSTLQNISTDLGNLYNQSDNQYQANQAASDKAAAAYGQYLTSNPATNTYNAQQIAGAERGASQAASAAKANLTEDLARRGIGMNSSAGAGGLASIEQGLASNDATIRNENAINNEQNYRQNLATNAGLWSNLANQSYNRATSAAGQQAGIESGLLSDADAEAMAQYNSAVAQNASNAQFWGGIAGAATSIPGLRW